MPLDELRTTLSQAVELDEPPVGAGPAAVFARADRTRTRQRLTALVSGIAVLGVAVGVAVVAADRPDGAPVAAPVPSVSAGAPSTPAWTLPAGDPSGPVRASTAPGAGRADELPGDVMLATLRRLLPAGVTASDPVSQRGFAELILTDPAGRGKIQINVQPNFIAGRSPGRDAGSDPMDLFSCATRPSPPGTTCTATTLADGTLVVLTDGPSEDAGHDRIKLRMADIYRPDGVRVVVGTWNAVHEKTNTATRAEPPLTTQQLQAIATDPAWPAKPA
ncbi:hypothetical protein AB0K00_25465 [Dactylosporangium sp. NPDC049525]|uniref:hypothetical protein n=1 Tax=Dactylosporangium sp. NPDC049525 TaxID=3154730 RepID=UPI003418F15F